MKSTLSLTSLAKQNFSYAAKELFFQNSLLGSSDLLQSCSFQEHLVPGSLREESEVGRSGSPFPIQPWPTSRCDLLWEAYEF